MQNIGDATLTFLGDTTKLDQVFARVPAEADAAMTAAAGSVSKLATALDAVNFELDATGSNVPYAGEKLKDVLSSSLPEVKTLGQSLIDAGKGGTSLADAFTLIEPPAKQTDAALQNMAFALTNVSPGFKQVAQDTRASTEEFKVSEEMLGIRLPRGINHFLSQIPGLGKAISLAFSAGVVFFLADAIAQVAEKLSSFIAETFIYTEAMKAADAASAKANQGLVEIAAATKKANDALAEYGMTASQKTAKAIEANSELFAENTKAITENRAKFAELSEEQRGVGSRINELSGGVVNTILRWSALTLAVDTNRYALKDNREEIRKLEDSFATLSQKNKELAQEMILLTLQLRDQEDAARKATLQKQESFSQAQISAQETVGKALLTLQKAQAEAEVVTTDESGVKKIAIQVAHDNAVYQFELASIARKKALAAQSENEMYQLEVGNLQNRMAVEKTLGAVGVAAAAATQVQIEQLTKSHHLKLSTDTIAFDAQAEALEKNHSAKMVQTYSEMMKTVKEIHTQGIETISSDATWSPAEKAAIKAATDIERAFQLLGITPTEQLKKALKEAGDAYTTLSKTGVASAHDLALAQLAVLNAQLQVNRALGDQTAIKATEKEIDSLTKSLQKWEGETVKSEKLWDLLTGDFKKKSKEMGNDNQQLAKMLGDGAASMQQAWESAISAAILGQKSFGEALKEATAQVLAQIAAQAAVHALYELALALAALAMLNFAGASQHAAAAAKFGAVAAVAGAGAYGLASSEKGGASGSGASSSTASTPSAASQQTGQQPVAVQNVPKLYSGAIVTQPTLAMVGDRQGGGSSTEGIFPLDDPRGKRALLEAFGMDGSGGSGGVSHNYYIQGMVSTSDLTKLTRVISRSANTGRVRMNVTNSARVTRKT